MRDPVSTSSLPDTLSERLAALRRAHARAPPSASGPPPTSPHRDDTSDLADRLARLRAPARGGDPEAGRPRRVPVGFKGVEELEAAAEKDDEEVERFLREVEEEEGRTGAAEAQLSDDKANELVAAILRSSSLPRGPLLPSPPFSPPLARARRSLPALSPSLLDTLSGVEVQFFRPGLAPSPSHGHVRGDDLSLGGEGETDEVRELMRRAGEEAEVERRQGEDGEAVAKGWEARLAGLGGVGTGAGAAAGTEPGGSGDALGSAPAREGVEQVERAVRRRERRRSGRGPRDEGEEDEEEEYDSEETESEEEESRSEGREDDSDEEEGRR